jgi:hypothetical protein
VLTVCGALSTVLVSYLVRRVPFFMHAVITEEARFVSFVTYGLALSLIASTSIVIRKRDTVIIILAATIMWVIFVETRQLLGMIRFLLFASMTTLGVSWADSAWGTPRSGSRILGRAILPGVLCCVAGLAYYGLAARFGPVPGDVRRELAVGSAWGFSLGLAVGLGISVGSEFVRWMSREDS